MKDGSDSTEVGKLALDVLAKLNTVDAETSSFVQAMTSQTNKSFSFPLSKTIGFQTIYIPATYLVAASGGPFALTLTTGVGGTTSVLVPISASGDTITSGDLIFDVYVDAAGNVISKAWTISGSNAKGSYQKVSDGTMNQRGTMTVTTDTLDAASANWSGNTAGAYFFNGNYPSFGFPVTFFAVPQIIGQARGYGISRGVGPTVSLINLAFVSGRNTEAGFIDWVAVGRWKS
jgi:hypothetical protein